mgnify:CR=1 FL=1
MPSVVPVYHSSQALETPSPQGSICGSLCGAEASEELFSMTEVANHCDHNSCWVVIDNIVYDITKFLDEVMRFFALLLPFYSPSWYTDCGFWYSMKTAHSQN